MKKLLVLMSLMLCAVSTYAADEVLFHWQSVKTAPTLRTPVAATGGTLTTITTKDSSTKDFSTEKIKGYAEGVAADMHAAVADDNDNGYCLKNGSGELAIKIDLTSGTFEAGDIIYICAYNPWSVGTSTAANEISGSITTGEDNSHYAVNSVIFPESSYTGTIYLKRVSSTTGIAAIKIVRPDKSKKTVTFSFSRASDNVSEGDAVSNITFTAMDGGNDVTSSLVSSITFNSNNPDIATVNSESGTISINTSNTGSAKVTASFDGDDTYNAAEASYTITVRPLPVTAVSPNKIWTFDDYAGNYTTNTKIDNLEIIPGDGNTITIESNKSTIYGETFTSRLKFGGTGSTSKRCVHFKVSGNCRIEVYVASASASDNTRPLGITIGSTEVVSEVVNETKAIGYTYTGGEDDVYIYSKSSGLNIYCIKVLPATVSKTVNAAGYATFYSEYPLNIEGVDGLKAYIATLSGTTINFEAVTAIPARTGVLLKGTGKTYDIPVAANNTDVSNNKFNGVLENTVEDAGIFVLMNGAQGVGFYKTTAAFTVGANTAYLPASVAGSRSFIGFGEDDTTGISSAVNAGQQTNEVFNLQGQRVSQPTKGLYIVDGKKVIIK